MEIMKKLSILLILMSLQFSVSAQNPKFDKLEMLFAQRHYKSVLRKANNLLDKPEYDFSMLPTYYKSIAMLELSQNPYWSLRHPEALDESVKLFQEVKQSQNADKIINAHIYELIWLKNDLNAWAEDLKRMEYKEQFEKVQWVVDEIFDDIPGLDEKNETPEEHIVNEKPGENAGLREEIVYLAKQYLGVPYVWAGSSPEGFDCSGFTSYILKQKGKELPRRATDQYNDSQKVKEKNVQKGDLVFFNNGSGISHVGIIISNPGEPMVMIHSSSSKGIVITEIDKSEYWKSRIEGFGTYVTN